MTRVVIVGEIYNADLSIGGGPIIPPSGGQPPGIWGPPGPWPTPPIAPGGPAPGVPTHPIYNPPYPDHGLPPFPSHPIAPGGPPLGIWGPPGPWPTPPIAPGGPYPDHSLPGQQPGIWGPTDPRPTPPIYIPGQPILPDSGDPTKAHIVVYVPGHGAVSFTVDLTTLPEPTPPGEAAPKPA